MDNQYESIERTIDLIMNNIVYPVVVLLLIIICIAQFMIAVGNSSQVFSALVRTSKPNDTTYERISDNPLAYGGAIDPKRKGVIFDSQ